MARRPVAWVAAIVLFVEAIGIALLNWFLGVVVDRQDMSGGSRLEHDVRLVQGRGLVFGLYFALCGVAALLVAVRDRAPGLFGRILLDQRRRGARSARRVHGGPGGLGAFVFMMVALGLIVFTLLAFDRGAVADAAPGDGAGGKDGNGGADGDANGDTNGWYGTEVRGAPGHGAPDTERVLITSPAGSTTP